MCLAELMQLYCLTELSNHGNAVKQELKHLEHEKMYADMKDSWEHPLRNYCKFTSLLFGLDDTQ